MSESSVEAQIVFVQAVISSPEKRRAFLADPEGYLKNAGLEPAAGLKSVLTDTLRGIEDEFERLGTSNPYGDEATEGATTMGRIVAAAVVSAAAAVVSAAAAVTTATSAAKVAK